MCIDVLIFVDKIKNHHYMFSDKATLDKPTMNKYGFFNKNHAVHYQLSPEELQHITVQNKQGRETASGVLAVKTGEFTGRSPKDRFIVKDEYTQNEVWWGAINRPFSPKKFNALYGKMKKYLADKDIFVRDAYACAAEDYRLNIRSINEHPWSNMFTYNMFLRPTPQELAHFKEDWLIVNAPEFMADPKVDGTRQHNFAILNFSRKIILIGGTAYTGEIKKGIFSILNFLMPIEKDTLPMHSSANIGKAGDTAIFFGLSGTGKTTLSADPARQLIGDDEHGWTKDNRVFNFEGGCYAKAIDLSQEKEPDIYNAIKPGALLENVILKKNGEVDFNDTSITLNTRVSYPLDHIDNAATPAIGENPKNIFFLTADAFGVLPPISKLTPGQAAYHFINGYTAKVAGTEEGIDQPEPNFSACFGAPFIPLHPTRYAEMLSQKMKENNTNVWLVNTGWTGGSYGTGKRMKLAFTRAMITAALSGELSQVTYQTENKFGFHIPTTCPNVPNRVLNPRKTWENKAAYDKKARELAQHFKMNFKPYEPFANEEIRSAQLS